MLGLGDVCASELQLLHSGWCPGRAFVDRDFRVQRQEIDEVSEESLTVWSVTLLQLFLLTVPREV